MTSAPHGTTDEPPYGRRARDAVEEARGHVALLLGAAPEENFFTSGGTEALVRGFRRACAASGRG